MKSLKLGFAFAVLVALLVVRPAGAAEIAQKPFYVTPFVGGAFFDKERQYSNGQNLNDVYFGGRAGARLTDLLWFDFAGGFLSTQPCATCTESWGHFSGNLMLSPAGSQRLNPFFSLGGGGSRSHHANGLSENSGTFEAATGLHVHLNDALGLRIEARNLLSVPRHSWNKAHINDIVLGAGVTFAFGGKAAVIDSDGDGVADRGDKCPNTPRGCKVDLSGCTTDADRDGVCDGIDQCPDTPKGCTVDARGCPVDTDGDGVCDGLDTCPNTVSSCQVDAHGCPIDSDGDGVCDGLDRCADTPKGANVDKDGCPINQREKQLETELLNTGQLRISNVYFDYDQSEIRSDSYAVLDTVGRVLTHWPGLKFEIGGHTDSRGQDAYNLRLSQRRAESVRDYLLEHFQQFERTQITAKGYGKFRPLVSNTSEENMQANRRVEFVVLNKEILQRQK